MSDTPCMTIFQSFQYLLKNAFGIPFLQSPLRLWFEIPMKRATSNIFHDQNDILRGINDLVKLNDVLMTHSFHQLDLSFHRSPSIWFLKLVLFIDLHCHFLVGRFVQTNPDNCICTLSDLFAYNIVIKAAVLWKYHSVIQIRICSLWLLLSRLLLFSIFSFLVIGWINILFVIILLQYLYRVTFLNLHSWPLTCVFILVPCSLFRFLIGMVFFVLLCNLFIWAGHFTNWFFISHLYILLGMLYRTFIIFKVFLFKITETSRFLARRMLPTWSKQYRTHWGIIVCTTLFTLLPWIDKNIWYFINLIWLWSFTWNRQQQLLL